MQSFKPHAAPSATNLKTVDTNFRELKELSILKSLQSEDVCKLAEIKDSVMICNLCKEDKKLIKKSHIIPDFFFKNLYDENHRLRKFDAVKMAKGDSDFQKPPTSIYEKHILCEKCDNEVINKYESYYARIYNDSNYTKHIFTGPSKINHIKYQNLDYNKANIFFLSIIWRAHLSSWNEFKDVSLSKDIAEKIRNQILSGVYDDSSIRITALKFSEESNFKRSVTQFKKIENTFTFILRDMIVFLHTGNDGTYALINKHQIEKNGDWVIPELPKKSELSFLKSYINP